MHAGHTVLVQSGAGEGIGFGDEAYQRAGASILPDAASVFAVAELIVKVKEPLPPEIALLRPGRFCSPISISRPTLSWRGG